MGVFGRTRPSFGRAVALQRGADGTGGDGVYSTRADVCGMSARGDVRGDAARDARRDSTSEGASGQAGRPHASRVDRTIGAGASGTEADRRSLGWALAAHGPGEFGVDDARGVSAGPSDRTSSLRTCGDQKTSADPSHHRHRGASSDDASTLRALVRPRRRERPGDGAADSGHSRPVRLVERGRLNDSSMGSAGLGAGRGPDLVAVALAFLSTAGIGDARVVDRAETLDDGVLDHVEVAEGQVRVVELSIFESAT